MSGKVHQFPGAAIPPEPPKDRLISEAEVVKFRPILSRGLLLAARKADLIAWTEGRQHTAWYTLADVDAYLETKKKPCLGLNPDRSSSLVDNGSQPSQAAPASIVSGMTPEMVERVGLASAQEILGKRKSG